ncbi:MAG TPA: glycosyltransferase family 4 protein [Candidatus Acidoferrum sp.]|jgi:glycosyltransferase involved in cell wall biosynthesis|nr:glycosyltransferase family 4 protein [Candidatus Acidoferrum sp.]
MTPVRVLSVQTTLLGNRTYAELLRGAFADSSRITFDAHWSPEQREMRIPGLKRLFWTRNPLRWVRKHNLDFYTARYEIGTSLLVRRFVKRKLAETRPNVLHLHSQNLALLSVDLMRSIPTVITADMTAMQTAQQHAPPGWAWTYAPNRRLEGAAFRAARAVATFSAWAARSIVEGHRVAPERVHVVPPGVDLQHFRDLDASRRASERARRIVFVGGEFVRKGGLDLVAVFLERFAADGVELHVVTSPEASVPAHPQIVVHRGVKAFSPEWRRVYEEADLFVMPTRADAAPFVFVEAMAAGIPVIGTTVGAVPEMIAENETGFVVAPGDRRALADRIALLLEDGALRRRMGESGQRRVAAHYDARVNAARLEQIFIDATLPFEPPPLRHAELVEASG